MRSDDAEARKVDMLDRIRTAHARLEHVVASLTYGQLETEGVSGEWSVKVTLGHITWWEQVPVHAFHGEADEDILPDEAWDTDRANAVLFARNRDRQLAYVLEAFQASYAGLLRELEALPAARLDEPGPYGGSLLELIAGNTYDHYDEHANLLAAVFGISLPQPPQR